MSSEYLNRSNAFTSLDIEECNNPRFPVMVAMIYLSSMIKASSYAFSRYCKPSSFFVNSLWSNPRILLHLNSLFIFSTSGNSEHKSSICFTIGIASIAKLLRINEKAYMDNISKCVRASTGLIVNSAMHSSAYFLASSNLPSFNRRLPFSIIVFIQ